MKCCIFLVFALLVDFSVLSQDEINGFVDVSQSSDLFINFTETDLSFGISLPIRKHNLRIFFSYQFGGNYGRDSIKPYAMNYHFIGGGFNYTFFSSDRVYSPTLKLQILTEIYSDYTGQKMLNHNDGEDFMYFPCNDVGNLYYTDKYVIGIYGHNAFDYISTPLITSIFLGNEFRIARNLFVNLSLGYQCRVIRVHKKSWNISETEPQSQIIDRYKIKRTQFGYTKAFHNFEFSLGINYTFPFKKQPQTTTP